MEQTYEERDYAMRRPYISRGDHDLAVGTRDARIADLLDKNIHLASRVAVLERELERHRLAEQTRRHGW